jgi:hypothetical protein
VRIKILLIPAALLLAVFAATALATRAGSWLVVEDPVPPRIDVVFTYTGENNRENYSIELVKKTGAFWVLSGRDAKATTQRVAAAGVDTSRFLFTGDCENTWQETTFITRWVNRSLNDGRLAHQNGPAVIALVSSPAHMRRIRLGVHKLAAHTQDARFVYLPMPDTMSIVGRRALSSWWRTESARNTVYFEMAKIVETVFLALS